MTKISAELEQQLRSQPEQSVDLIVRTAGDVTPYLQWLAAQGLQVTQQFRLTPGIAVTGAGQDALKLLSQAWVVSVELDKPVKALNV
jgi:hypothetical protein